MAENSTPTAPAAGTGTNAAAPAAVTPPASAPAGDPKIPTDPVEAAKYWQDRHTEATAHSTRNEQQNARYRELYGDLKDDKAPKPAAPVDGSGQPALPANVWTDEKQKDHELTQQIARVPTLVPHADEIKTLIRGGLTLAEAKSTVAGRHNITLGPSVGPLDMMPGMPGGGPSGAGASEFTDSQLAAMQRDGVNPDDAKKYGARAKAILSKAK
jgi:hypothetical protein